MFAAFAADANALGALLRRTYCIDVQGGQAIDLSDGTERDLLLAALQAGAAQHLASGEDLLTRLERLNRMNEAGPASRDSKRRTELAIVLLRAMTLCELVEAESRERFPRHRPLAALSAGAMRQLASGYLRVLGYDIPRSVRRAFPRFSRAVRAAAQVRGLVRQSMLERLATVWPQKRLTDPGEAPQAPSAPRPPTDAL